MKTLKELLEEQNEWCDSHSCVGCPYAGYNPNPNAQSAECTTVFVYEKMKEAMDRLGEDAKVQTQKSTADKMKAVQLPAWCKEGRWIIDHSIGLCKVLKIKPSPALESVCVEVVTTEGYVNTRFIQELHPARFRSYTYKEAERLLGTTLRYKTEDSRMAALVYDVYECDDNSHVCINGLSQLWLQKHDATIGGLPIGVPEVDTEAMKEVRNE